VLIATALAVASQALFDHLEAFPKTLAALPLVAPPAFHAAAAALVTGGALFAVAAPLLVSPPVASPAKPVPSLQPARPGTAAANGLLVAAIALYAAQLALYLAAGESALMRLLWLGSVGLLIVSAALHDWGAGRRLPPIDGRKLVLPGLILLLALALRAYRLADLPQDLHGDMASHGLQARALLDGASRGLAGYGWASIPLVGFLPTAVAMALSGDRGLLGLGLASVAGGVLSVAGLGVVLHEVLGRRVALMGAVLLAVSYTHIHFSRIAEYMDPLPFAAWSLALLAVGLRRGPRLAFVPGGMALAAAGLVYPAGRVMWVVVPLILLYLLVADRRLWTLYRWDLALMALAALIVAGPLPVIFLQHPAQFLGRAPAVILLNPEVMEHLRLKYGVAYDRSVVLEQLRRMVLVFNYYGDTSTQFGLARPMVDALTGPLVVLGTAFGLRHMRHWACAQLVIWLVLVLAVGGVLTNNAPFWPRLVLALLPAAGLAALALDRIWQAAEDAAGATTRRLLPAMVLALIVGVGVANWQLYHAFARQNGRPRALVARMVAELPVTATVCLVPEDASDPATWIHSVQEREIAFLLAPRAGFDVEPTGQPSAQAIAACSAAGAVWVVPAGRQEVLTWLEQRYPLGMRQSHGATAGQVAFYSYEVGSR
jgi:hypothetical protein